MVKKTDKNKSWGQKRKIGRKRYKTILIVCEGQTEKLYFDSFVIRKDLKVEVIDKKGQTKLKLVNETSNLIKTLKKKEKYEEVWCVFDMDKKEGGKDFSDFDNAISKAKSNQIKVAYSNDCFELWFYLHYHYIDNEEERKFYFEKLGEKWGINYEKEGKKENFSQTIYEKLKDKQNKAIKNAKKLYDEEKNKDFRKTKKYHKQNPITTVFKLVKFLNKNLRP